MIGKISELDIELINKCFKIMKRNDDFLPITYKKIEFDQNLLEECALCVDDVYHLQGVDNMYEPNELGLKLYHLIEKINHQIYILEEIN